MLANSSCLLFFGVSVACVYFGVDPLFIFLGGDQAIIIGSPVKKTIYYVIRLVIFSFSVHAGWQLIFAFVLLNTISLWIVRKASSHLRNWGRLKLKISKVFSYGQFVKTGKYELSYFSTSHSIQMHREINILVQIVCDAYYFLLPSIVLLGFGMLVVCNYGVIRLTDNNVPPPVYVIMPALSFFVSGVIMAFFGPAALVHEDSKELLEQLKQIKRGKYWKKVIKSQRTIRIYFASLFYASVITESMFYWKVVECTITSILISR
jgi:hypothetical protein